MKKRGFDRKLEHIAALRQSSDTATVQHQLREALGDRSNFVVARAAAVIDELKIADLIPDLVTAFHRFFMDPENADPRCFAKEAIARALRGLGHRDAETYVRGITHLQYEPAWGGRVDTAAGLRGTCVLALSECPWDWMRMLTYLVAGLADPDATVRANTAIALDQIGRPEGALLLRLKLLLGDEAPDVIRQCFAAFLSLEPHEGVSFVASFLKSEHQDARLEAACALAECRDPQAITVLRNFWQDLGLSSRVREAIIISLGASPLEEAAGFLLEAINQSALQVAVAALEALAASRFRAEIRERVYAAVCARGDPRLNPVFARGFGETAPAS
jgi:HEAT repeat protein